MKILIIRFSSIGDLILTTAAIRCLKNTYPDAEIHLLVKANFQEVLKNNPHISVFHLFTKNNFGIVEQLKQQQFDYIIDLQNNIKSNRISNRLRAKTFHVKKENVKKWLMVQFNMRFKISHFAERCVESLKELEVKNDGKGLDFYYDDTPIPNHLIPTEKYIVIVLGGTFQTKQFPVEKINQLIEILPYPIVILGGPAEVQMSEKIIKKESKVYNLTGSLNLSQSAKMIRNCEVIVTNDTGLMHLSAALKKPMAVIWGNTIPEFGMYPYYGNEMVPYLDSEVTLNCRPCSKLGSKKCPKKHFNCMNFQDVQKIASFIHNIYTNQVK